MELRDDANELLVLLLQLGAVVVFVGVDVRTAATVVDGGEVDEASVGVVVETGGVTAANVNDGDIIPFVSDEARMSL